MMQKLRSCCEQLLPLTTPEAFAAMMKSSEEKQWEALQNILVTRDQIFQKILCLQTMPKQKVDLLSLTSVGFEEHKEIMEAFAGKVGRVLRTKLEKMLLYWITEAYGQLRNILAATAAPY